MQSLPAEFELAASQIAAKHYPFARYKLYAQVSKDDIKIEFIGYYTENFDPNNRPIDNPTDEFYRNSKIDFTLGYGYNRLHLSGWWRSSLLSLEYQTPEEFLWINEDGEDIPRPYPDGDKFESIAMELYPLSQKYFGE